MTKEDMKQMIVTMCPVQKTKMDMIYRRNKENYEGKKDFYGKMIIAGFEAVYPNAQIPKIQIIDEPTTEVDIVETEDDPLDDLY